MVVLRRWLNKILVFWSFKLYIVQGSGENAWFDQWKQANPIYYKAVSFRWKVTIISGAKESYDIKEEVKSMCEIG